MKARKKERPICHLVVRNAISSARLVWGGAERVRRCDKVWGGIDQVELLNTIAWLSRRRY